MKRIFSFFIVLSLHISLFNILYDIKKMENGELELNQCNPYFVENRVSIRFSPGDILYSNILNVPIV